MGGSYYDVGLACLNGHSINSYARSSPVSNAKFCKTCGEKSIDACPKCSATIRGKLHVPNVASLIAWRVPSYCHECGEPYPWTQRKTEALSEVIDELDNLDEAERNKLKQSIPDIIRDTPKTETATVRFKKAIMKTGQLGGKLLGDVLAKVATEAVSKQLGI